MFFHNPHRVFHSFNKYVSQYVERKFYEIYHLVESGFSSVFGIFFRDIFPVLSTAKYFCATYLPKFHISLKYIC